MGGFVEGWGGGLAGNLVPRKPFLAIQQRLGDRVRFGGWPFRCGGHGGRRFFVIRRDEGLLPGPHDPLDPPRPKSRGAWARTRGHGALLRRKGPRQDRPWGRLRTTASSTARSTAPNTERSSRKRTSILAGCTFTSTSSGGRSMNRTICGYSLERRRPFVGFCGRRAG